MSLRVTLSALALTAALPGLAAAERDPELAIRTRAAGPPELVARVIGGPRVGADRISLADDAGHLARPSAIARGADSDEAWAIAIVFEGDEIWCGNDKIIDDETDPTRYAGPLLSLEADLDRMDLAHALPRGSEIAVIDYAASARVRRPLGAAATFTGAALGTQKDHYGRIGRELVPGVQLGLAELDRSTAPQKLLVVIGDGNDTNNETAKIELQRARHLALAAHVELHAITYKDVLSDEGNVVATLVPSVVTVSSAESMGASLRTALTGALDTTTLVFALDDLAADGRPHALTLTLDGEPMPEVVLDLPNLAPAREPWRVWWVQLLAGLGMVGLLAVLTRWRAVTGVRR